LGFYKSKSDAKGDELEGRTEEGGAVPPSAARLAWSNFKRELFALLNRDKNEASISSEEKALRAKIDSFTLSNDAIWEREHARPQIEAPIILKAPYYLLCLLLDVLFDGKPISRLYFLENVARMPYFSYITCLHAYETLGWWRRSNLQKRIHFAEELNELNHLQIMESLGGDQLWQVRFFAQHSAVVYYFVLIALWLLSPSLAYNFSELIESHAVDTYAEFAFANKDVLKTMPVPECAQQYYLSPDMFFFDEFQSQRPKGSRRPEIQNLYDVFMTIADDEAEHVRTMRACQDPNVKVTSPNTEAAIFSAALAGVAAFSFADIDSLDSVFDLTSVESLYQNLMGNAPNVNVGDVVDAVAAGKDVAADAGVGGGVAGASDNIGEALDDGLIKAASQKGMLVEYLSSILQGLLKLL